MKIENCWHDANEFHVSFRSKDNRIIKKQLIFLPSLTEKEIQDIVYSCFNKVDKIIYIEKSHNVVVYKHNKYKIF